MDVSVRALCVMRLVKGFTKSELEQ